MKRFLIITNRTKDKRLEVTGQIQAYIEQKGGICYLAEENYTVPDDVECVLVLGGDGTFIQAARELPQGEIPMLGINMGTLGYLTEVEISDVEQSLDRLMQNDFSVEKRMLLQGTIEGQETNLALNDIVLTRTGKVRVIQFRIYVNGELLNTYCADGVIVSTPTGSTAYNLSAGGPVVEPTASLIVITPICSHALNTSSIVLSADDEIVLEVGSRRDGNEEEAVVSFDGETDVNVRTGERIIIRKAETTAKVIKLSNISFLEIMRRKMKGN